MEQPTELFDYIATDDPAYRWRIVSSAPAVDSDSGACRVDIDLASQTWQSILWRHRLTLFIPKGSNECNTALLIIGADGPCSSATEDLGRLYALKTGMTCAFLFDVPNQPLFDGRVEDSLIAYSLVQHLDTGEQHWPLLLPMTKSAAAAMTAVSEHADSVCGAPIRRFIVTGASKRGWTTWLIAAADARVAGIAPVVFDNLNLLAQMPHQRAVFDNQYSDQISDYAESGLMERMATPAGFELARLIDPYTYRTRITVPKLIINGSNDPYWATDAISLYWQDLSEPKSVLYVPNQPHSINDPYRVDSTLIEFAVRTNLGECLPQVTHRYGGSDSGPEFSVESDTAIRGATCWVARSSSQDFRASTWSAEQMDRATSTSHKHTITQQHGRYTAIFGELRFEGASTEFTLSTPITVLAGAI